MTNKLVSQKCVEFIKEFEGFYPKAYLCPAFVWTIGYGTTNPEYVKRETCTKEEATMWLMEEIEEKAKYVKKDLDSKGVVLNQNEMDALVSFAYNCGTGGLLNSTLYKNICKGIRDSKTITENFQAWSNANGKRLEGLFRRRTREAEMFLEKIPATIVKTVETQIKFRKPLNIIKECNCIDSKGAIAKTFKANDKVTAINEYFGYWILSIGKIPKVCCEEIIDNPKCIEGIVQVKNALNIREKADANSKIVGIFKNGDKVSITEVKNNFGKTRIGWICMDYVKKF